MQPSRLLTCIAALLCVAIAPVAGKCFGKKGRPKWKDTPATKQMMLSACLGFFASGFDEPFKRNERKHICVTMTEWSKVDMFITNLDDENRKDPPSALICYKGLQKTMSLCPYGGEDDPKESAKWLFR
jgi:hypothetical protein